MPQVDWWSTTTNIRRKHLDRKPRTEGKGSADALGEPQSKAGRQRPQMPKEGGLLPARE